MTLGLGIIWLNNAYVFPKNIDIPEDATSVIFWNTADRAHIPTDILSEKIHEMRPDIIAFVEAENASEEDIIQLSEEFPDYEFRILEANMFIGVKGTIDNVSFTAERYSYDINFIDMTLQSGSILLALTDTFQDPTMNKRKTLHSVLELATEKKADLMVGDYNTPYESVHFRAFEKNYQSFHDYGKGFSATWLFGIPLLEIDQIFLRKKSQPILLEKFNYNVSDHAMLIGHFKL